MPSTDKLISMLSSPKASVRFEACEELRVADESSEGAVAALEKAAKDDDGSVADAAVRALQSAAHSAMLLALGRPSYLTTQQRAILEQESRREQEAQALGRILLVTTPMVEGRPVAEYLGVVSAEVVMGTGFLSEFEAGLADLLGVRADKFQEKLKYAKDAAINSLRLRAIEMNAEGIIGLDLDYSVIGRNLLMVVANGTAVRFSQSRASCRAPIIPGVLSALGAA